LVFIELNARGRVGDVHAGRVRGRQLVCTGAQGLKDTPAGRVRQHAQWYAGGRGRGGSRNPPPSSSRIA